jgi:hypothetical protein
MFQQIQIGLFDDKKSLTMQGGVNSMKATVQLHLFTAALIILTSAGCAVHYYDTATDTEHLLGIGHMKMKAAQPNEGLQAVVHGIDILGASIGKADKQTYFTVGWHRLQFIDVLKESTSIRLEWPTSSFVDVRIGSEFPLYAPPTATQPEDELPLSAPEEELQP